MRVGSEEPEFPLHLSLTMRPHGPPAVKFLVGGILILEGVSFKRLMTETKPECVTIAPFGFRRPPSAPIDRS
jgi:hypothetical protein